MATRPACVFVLAQPVLGVGQQAKNGSNASTNKHPKIAGRPRAGLIEVLIVFHDVIIAENPAPAPQLTPTSKLPPVPRSAFTVQRRCAGEGLGPSNLYSFGEGQRARPTARKVPESNKVLTLRASSAVPVRGEIPLSVARFSCALSVRIWVSQGRTGEGNKLGASHPVFWIPPWQVFACLELTNWFPKRRNHDRSNGAKNTAMA